MEAIRGTIFDIQHFSLHDGPGVRSTVFFKGCPLSCWWCSNPESQRHTPELLFFRHLCTGCGSCVSGCDSGALDVAETGLVMRRASCTACGNCVQACLHGARSLSGRSVTVAEVCDEVRGHWRIFQQSGGGITCSGGEVLAQPKFLEALLTTLHDELGLHTCLDSCAKAPRSVLARMLPHLDMVLLDIKHLDGEAHRSATGAGNEDILENAVFLAESDIPVLVRLPLIPGFNDDDEHLKNLGCFLKDHSLLQVEIMPYHAFGFTKYAALGKTHASPAEIEPRIDAAVEELKRHGLSVEVHQQ